MLRRLLLPATLALLPAPALADVTARYAVGAAELTIEAADGGDWRVEVPGEFTLIRRDKVDYVVMVMGKETMVFKLGDLLNTLKPKVSGKPGKAGPDAFTRAKFTLVRGADVVVAGYKGTNWSFGPEERRPGGHRAEVVTSKDPALAPVGAIFLEIGRQASALGEGQFGPDSNFLALANALFASGAPLRVEKVMELRSVDGAAIDPKRFVLPGPVLDPALMDSKTTPGRTVTFEPLPPPQPAP